MGRGSRDAVASPAGRSWRSSGRPRGTAGRCGSRRQLRSSTGWTSRSKLNPRAGPFQGWMAVGRACAAGGVLGGRTGVLPLVAADARGGFARHGRVPQRICCWALPSASNGCTKIGVLAGTRNSAEPSWLTGTVPRIRFTSQPPSKLDGPGVAVARVAEVVRAHAEGLDRAAGITAEAVALVDVGQVDHAVVLGRIDVRGDDRRHGPRRTAGWASCSRPGGWASCCRRCRPGTGPRSRRGSAGRRPGSTCPRRDWCRPRPTDRGRRTSARRGPPGCLE